MSNINLPGAASNYTILELSLPASEELFKAGGVDSYVGFWVQWPASENTSLTSLSAAVENILGLTPENELTTAEFLHEFGISDNIGNLVGKHLSVVLPWREGDTPDSGNTQSAYIVTENPYSFAYRTDHLGEISGFHINATDAGETITSSDGGDQIRGDGGDDVIDFGASGTTGNDWLDRDVALYQGSWSVQDRSTGQVVPGFSIEQLQNGSIRITDLITGNVDEGTDVLTNVDLIRFEGDGTEILIAPRENYHMWGGETDRTRKLDLRGGIFNDTIQGTQFEDYLDGGDGDDVILGGDIDSKQLITIAGGDPWGSDLFGRGNARVDDANLILSNVEIDLGTQSRMRFFADSEANFIPPVANGSLQGKLVLHVDSIQVREALKSEIVNLTLEALTNRVAELRAEGARVEMLVEHKSQALDGYVLVDLVSAVQNNGGDGIRGGRGNDFIDGGDRGFLSDPDDTWHSSNRSEYLGSEDEYLVRQFQFSSDLSSTTFNDGSLVSDYADHFGLVANTLKELIAVLDMPVGTYATEGDTVTVVGDTIRDRDGLDLLINVQILNFQDTSRNLEIRIQSTNYGEDQPAGKYIEGTVFNDRVIDGENLDLSGHDQIYLGAGNDIVVAGDSGDHINVGSGYNFVDGGASGTSTTDSWGNANELRIDGAMSRFELSRVSYDDAVNFMSTKMGLVSDEINNLLGSDLNQTFLKISDKVERSGNGETLFTNIDRVNFNDDHITTQINVHVVQGSELHYEDNETYTGLANKVNLDGTQFQDYVDLTDPSWSRYFFDKTDDIWAHIFDINDPTAGYPEGTTFDNIDYLLNFSEFRAGSGDDVFIGNEYGSYVQMDAGNDIVDGKGNEISPQGVFNWLTRDFIRFSGNIDRYVIEKVTQGDIVTKAGAIVAASEFNGTAGDILYDMTDLAGTGVQDGQGRIVLETPSETYGFIIRDRLPSEFGGDGIDLAFGVESIEFNGTNIDPNAYVEFRFRDWLRGGVDELDVEASYFGGTINTSQLVVDFDRIDVIDSFTNGSQLADVVIGLEGRNEVLLRGGNDVYIDHPGGSAFENEGIFGDPWDYIDNARYSGSKSRYDVERVGVKITSNSEGLPELETVNGKTVFYTTEEAENDASILQAIRVTDKLGDAGDGTDVLIGIEELRFADTDMQLWIESNIDIWSSDWGGALANDLGITDNVQEIVFRQNGTDVGEVLEGMPPLGVLPPFYDDLQSFGQPITIGAATKEYLLGKGVFDIIPVLSNWQTNGSFSPVGIIREYYERPNGALITDTNWTIKAFIESGEIVDENDTVIATFHEAIEEALGDLEAALISSGNPAAAWGNLQLVVQTISDTNGAVPIFELSQTLDGNEYFAVAVPAFEVGSSELTFETFKMDGRDVLEGRGGDDLLIGNGGQDRFEPGFGNDTVIGASEEIRLHIDPYSDPWETDRVEYDGNSDRYSIEKMYAYVSSDNLADLSSLVRHTVDELGQDPQDGSVLKAVFRVTDLIDNPELNTGQDLLVDVGLIRFRGDNAHIQLSTYAQFEIGDWIPGVSTEVIPPEGVSSLSIWDATRFDENIDFNVLWNSTEFSEMKLPAVQLFGRADDFSEDPRLGAEIAGTVFVKASEGVDTYYGVTSENVHSEFRIELGDLTDYALKRETDADGNSFVEISLSPNASISKGIGTTRLYDFDTIQFETTNQRLLLDTSQNYWIAFNRQRAAIDTSIFDDTIDASDISPLFIDTGLNPAGVISFIDNYGNDTYSLEQFGEITTADLGPGNDTINLGSGFDVIYTTAPAENFEIRYFKTDNGNEFEISRLDFIDQGISNFYDPLGDEVDYQTFVDSHSVHLVVNYDFSELYKWPAPTLHNPQLGQPGNFEYESGYSIKLIDTTGSNRYGTDTLTGVDAIWLGGGIYDILTDKFLTTYDVNEFSFDNNGIVTVNPEFLVSSSEIMSPPTIVKKVGPDFDIYDLSDVEIRDMLETSYVRENLQIAGSQDTVTAFEFRVSDDESSRIYNGSAGTLTYLDLEGSQQVAIGADDFRDGFGDDIYRGNGAYRGTIENPIVSRDDWAFGDKVRFNDVQERFDISYGRLNSEGYITGLIEGDTWYGQKVGDAYESYVQVSDKDQTLSSGYGVNYLFDISRVVFDGSSLITGQAIRFNDQTDRPDNLRIESSPMDDFIDARSDAHYNSLLSNGILTAVRYDAKGGHDFFAGFDNQSLSENMWDLDQVRISDLQEYFDVTRGWIQRDVTGKVITSGPFEYVEFFEENHETDLTDGASWHVAAKISDNRDGVAKRYDDIIVSDIEVISFVDEGVTIPTRQDFELGNYDIWLGHNTNIPMGQWIQLQTGADAFGLQYTFDGENFAGQTLVDIETDSGVRALGHNIWSGGTYDDTIVILGTEQRVDFNINGGDDYVYMSDHSGSAVDYAGISEVRFDGVRSQYQIEQVWTTLDADFKPVIDSRGQWNLSSTAADGKTAGVLISDTSVANGDRKLIIGVGEARFDDMRVTLNQNIRIEDWDGDGITDYLRYEGTEFSDLVLFDKLYDGIDTIEEEFEGGSGNDTLVGGAGGDRFRGGFGDDIIFGGTNGAGDEWNSYDRVDYWDRNADDFSVERALVGVNYDTNEVLRDTSGNIILDPTDEQLGTKFTSVQGVFVEDLVADEGTDLLIDVERLDLSERDFALNITTRSDDWNQDGVIDYARVDGTSFDDVISDQSVSASFLELDNDIDAGPGNDIVQAGVGGDYIRVGTGNDIVFGGADGQETEWGWIRRDEVRFDNPYSRYDIETIDWEPGLDAKNIADADGNTVFVIDLDGTIYRRDNGDDSRINTIGLGDRITIVRDKMPSDPLLGGDGVNLLIGVENLSFKDKWMGLEVEYNVGRDEQGNIEWSWIRGTEFNDVLKGTVIGDGFQDGSGDDTLIGGRGSDHFTINGGDDVVYGDLVDQVMQGDDHDTVRFDANYAQFIVNATVDEFGRRYISVKDTVPGEFGLGENRLYDIEGLSFADRYLNVGVNIDTFENTNGTFGTHINGSVFGDTIQGTENGDSFWTGAGNDILYGGKGADFFTPGDGDDIVYGGEEGLSPWGHNDVDTVHFDRKYTDVTIQYFNSDGATSANFDADGHIVVTYTGGNSVETDTLYGVERLDFNDRSLSFEAAYGYEDGKYVWKGTEQDDSDTVNFSDQNERFYGYGGNDIIEGGLGDDDFIGGAGNDVLYGNTKDRTGDDIDEIGNPFVDTAIFEGNFSEYTVTKNDDDGYWEVSENSDVVNDDTDTLYDIEVLRFADRSEWLIENIVSRDTDRDGASDLYIVQGTINSDDFDLSSYSNVDVRLFGGAGNDTAIFNDNVNAFVMDTLGTNTYTAGSGLGDVAEFNGLLEDWDVDDTVEGQVTISNSLSSTTLIGFERIMFDDSTYNLVKTYEELDTDRDGTTDTLVIEGADSNDDVNYASSSLDVRVSGNGGDDTITTGAGDDIISGDEGNDVIDGGLGFDTYVTAFNRADLTVEYLGEDRFKLLNSAANETDEITNIERIQFLDGGQRLRITETTFRDFVVGEGFKNITKTVGTVFDDVIEVTSANDAIVVSGTGEDRIEIESASQFDVTLSDFSLNNDQFVFVSQNAIEDAAQMSVGTSDSDTVISLSGGGQLSLVGNYAETVNNIQTVDLYFSVNETDEAVTKITAGGADDNIDAISNLEGSVVVMTGNGEDTVNIDASLVQDTFLIDINRVNDTLNVSNAELTSVTQTTQGLDLEFASGAKTHLAGIEQGEMMISLDMNDTFVFNEETYDADQAYVAKDDLTLIIDVMGDPDTAATSWRSLNEAVSTSGSSFDIGTGTFTVEWSDPDTLGTIYLEFI